MDKKKVYFVVANPRDTSRMRDNWKNTVTKIHSTQLSAVTEAKRLSIWNPGIRYLAVSAFFCALTEPIVHKDHWIGKSDD